MTLDEQAKALNAMVAECHGRSLAAGWHHDLETGKRIKKNVAEQICLIHSELSEALEGHRRKLSDDHLPARKSIEVELADAVIRIMDLCGDLQLDLGGAFAAKLEYNSVRADHKREARLAGNGKAY